MHTIHVIIEFKQIEPKRSQTKKGNKQKMFIKNRTYKNQNHTIYITLKQITMYTSIRYRIIRDTFSNLNYSTSRIKEHHNYIHTCVLKQNANVANKNAIIKSTWKGYEMKL